MNISIRHLDIVLTQALNGMAMSSASVDDLMIWSSAFGVPVLVAAVAGQWWRRADRLHHRHVLVSSGLAFCAGLAFNQLILLFVHRLRPYDANVTHLIIERSADFSFPSDHATATFAIAAVFLLHGVRKAGTAFLLAAILIAASRVYVGIHYVSDVLGGALTGVMAAVAVKLVYRENSRLDRFVTGIF